MGDLKRSLAQVSLKIVFTVIISLKGQGFGIYLIFCYNLRSGVAGNIQGRFQNSRHFWSPIRFRENWKTGDKKNEKIKKLSLLESLASEV